MCNVTGTLVQGHMSIMLKVCIPMLLVTLLIAVSSYGAYYTVIVVSYLQ